MDRVRQVFTAELMAARRDLGDPSSAPVFIVGMPRSGTTLVEQLLASHPAVFGAGERLELPQAVAPSSWALLYDYRPVAVGLPPCAVSSVLARQDS